MFSIQTDFDLSALTAFVNGEVDYWIEDIGERYKVAGRRFVDKARAQTKEDGGFGNITWNLRSSIGCLLLVNGKVIDSYFPVISGGNEGAVTGDAYAREVSTSNEFDSGVGLIIVAGMDYASLVEAQNKDVITHIGKSFPKDLLAELNS